MKPTKPSNFLIAAWLRKRAENVIVALIAVMFVSFLLQIAFRYLLNRPLGWTDEVTVLCWVWLVLWGASFILSDKDEIRFDIVYELVPERTRRTIRCLAACVLELCALHEA
jgi:TRAP-type C4-dicarboxylate transport system permease small subunit